MTDTGLAPADSGRLTATRKKLSLLIVQMGGIEDVFRSLMALKAVKHLYPETSIHILSRSGVSDPFKRVEWIDSVTEAPNIKKSEDPVARTALWIDQIIHQNYDILANWTASVRHSRMAALVTTLIPAVVKLGDFVTDDLVIHSADAWSMYRRAWTDAGVEQDIHETDRVTTQLLTALQIHAGDPSPDSGMVSVTSRYFFKPVTNTLPKNWANRPKGLKWIAIHSGSAPGRIEEWIEMVLRRHPDHGIVLFGEKGSIELDSNPRVIELGSEIHFDSTLSVLTHCSWLVSGSHPIVDLASLVNLRVFYHVGSETREFGLNWTGTGPYGNGHIILSPREEWQPEVAYAAWSYYQSEWFHKNSITVHGHFENLGLISSLEEVQVYKSRIRPAGEGGGVSYDLAAGPIQDFENWIYRVRGQMARAWFCGWLPSVDEEVAKLNLTPELIKKIRSLSESVEVIERLAFEGRMTASSLGKTAEKMRTGYLMSVEDRTEIEESGKKLLEIEGLISRVGQVEPELQCLLKWYQQMIHNLEGTTIPQMSKETMGAFDLVIEGVDLISAYTRKTLEQARPKAVGVTIAPVKTPELDS
jgi:ADP-heptose:LPS heptosyltransferase